MNLNSQFVKKISKISATLIILSPLADPSFAQSEELRRLTKELLGSAFDNHGSEVAPLGVINKNTGRIQRVVENTVDKHSNKLPIFQKQFEKTISQVVEILIPIKTGIEYSMLQAKYPNIKIQESPGGVAILVGSNTKALPMYLLGKKIQEEFGFSFELSYSNGHPDLDMAWLTPFKSNQIAYNSDRNKKPISQKSKVPVYQPVISENAVDLGNTLSRTAPWLSQDKLTTNTTNNFTKKFINDTDQRKNDSKTAFQKVNKLPPLVAPPAITEIKASNSRNIQNRLISSVKITPVRLENVAIASSKLIATNKSLNYLYVEIADNNDLDKIKANGKAVNILRNKNNKLLARVGIYSNTNVGNRLKAKKLEELEANGFNVVAYDAAVA